MNNTEDRKMGDEHWQGDDRRHRDSWHVGREIPIAVVMAILVQTAGSVWWASALSTKLDVLQAQMIELKAERYTSNDARRDFESMRIRVDNSERRIADLEQFDRSKRP